jgi:hypothetical protein
VSDFLSRLVARGAGEQEAVRPRIAPAFAERRVGGERLPAGDILESPPDVSRAISPLAIERPPRVTPAGSYREGSSAAPISAPHRETITRFDYRDRVANAQERGAEQGANETPTLPSVREVGVAHARDVFPVRVTRAEFEPQESTALRAIRAGREVAEDVKPSLGASEPSREVPARTALRPAVSKSAWPREVPKKTSANESATIHVTIGRIEVRASLAASKPAEKKVSNGAMSLAEYERLRSRRSAG